MRRHAVRLEQCSHVRQHGRVYTSARSLLPTVQHKPSFRTHRAIHVQYAEFGHVYTSLTRLVATPQRQVGAARQSAVVNRQKFQIRQV